MLTTAVTSYRGASDRSAGGRNVYPERIWNGGGGEQAPRDFKSSNMLMEKKHKFISFFTELENTLV